MSATTKDTAVLLQRAERDRVEGSCLIALGDYYTVIAKGTDEQRITATHMLGVAYRVLRRYAEAEAVLDELLDDPLVEEAPMRKGGILRDLADTERKRGDLPGAGSTIQEAIDLFSGLGDDGLSGLAMSYGFLSRIWADRDMLDAADTAARQADELFAQVDDPPAKFYHDLWSAQLSMLSGHPKDARRKALSLAGQGKPYIKPSHRRRISLIINSAHSPKAFKEAIAASDPE